MVQSVNKIFEDIKKVVGTTKILTPIHSLYPGFNPEHWEKNETIMNEMELEKETMDLENKMVSVQGWSLVKFSQHFPMIYLANLNFALETMKTTVSPIPKPPKFYTAPETELSYACAVYLPLSIPLYPYSLLTSTCAFSFIFLPAS